MLGRALAMLVFPRGLQMVSNGVSQYAQSASRHCAAAFVVGPPKAREHICRTKGSSGEPTAS